MPPRGISPALMLLLIVTLLTSAATMHYHTPMLDAIRVEFDASAQAIGWIPTTVVVGYVIGLFAIVPLGDAFEKRTLIVVNLGFLAIACAAAALAPSVLVIAIAGFFIGALATTTQHIVPLAADLAPPAERGRAVGTVLSGLMLGILFGRLAGGFIASAFGWRAAYWMAVVMLAILIPLILKMVPMVRASVTLSYGQLLWSLVGIMRENATLRRISFGQLLINVCYGLFWSTLALMLASNHGLGSSAAGLIGIPGAAGVLIARPVGRLVDRRGPRLAVTVGCAFVLAAFLCFGFGALSVAAIVIGATLLDIGIRASQVANQSFIAHVESRLRTRTNMIFMTHVFAGNALGAMIGSVAWAYGGWNWVAACGVLFAALATGMNLLHARAERLRQA